MSERPLRDMVPAMGLYPQPDEYTCGPFALKHALATLGVIADEDDLRRYSQTHWWTGTDEIKLARAARAYGCDLELVCAGSAELGRKRLVAELRKKRPVLLCVDDWGHWITVVSHQAGNFAILDSNLDPILAVLSWRQLERRWVYRDTDYDEEIPPLRYDMHPVVPRFRPAVRARFSVARVQYLRRAENRTLAREWASYFEDLLDVCRPKAAQTAEPLSMAEFLRRNQDLIVGRVLYWHGDIEEKALRKLLANFRFVAETYGLIVPKRMTRRAVVDMAILATLWTVAERGVGPVYGAGGD